MIQEMDLFAFLTICLLPLAFTLDAILGDPRFLPHPIRWMGSAIIFLEPRFRKLPISLLLSGALFSIGLIAAAWTATAILAWAAGAIHPVLGASLEIILVYYCISARSLEDAAMDVHKSLAAGRLTEARQKVGMIVGRDTDELSGKGVTKAAVETVAENLVDGVVSPLFFAAIGGAPLAMAYKMVNTLDSMIGYKDDRYLLFGRFAARMDDVANFIPARLSVPIISLAAHILCGNGRRAFETARVEGGNHTSPNAGRSEAAFAGALGVKLIGPALYRGRRVDKPYIGAQFEEVREGDVKKACDLMLLSSLLWVGLAWGMGAGLGVI